MITRDLCPEGTVFINPDISILNCNPNK